MRSFSVSRDRDFSSFPFQKAFLDSDESASSNSSISIMVIDAYQDDPRSIPKSIRKYLYIEQFNTGYLPKSLQRDLDLKTFLVS